MDDLKFVISYSCGKDSTLALHRMIRSGYKCEGLIVTMDKEDEHSFFHSVPKEMIESIAEALEFDLIPLIIDKEQYRSSFVEALKALTSKDVRLCAFGDIDIKEHREWCVEVCKEAGMAAVFPLWQENRESLVSEFIDLGYKGIIKTVNTNYLSEEFLGKRLDHEIVEEIVRQGSDACGENGEYHTLVIDGPLFKKSVDLKFKGLKQSDNYASLLI